MIRHLPAAMRAAFPYTIPVMTGFAFLGIAYGILMSDIGFGVPWIALVSFIVFAGALQFVAIGMLTSAFDPIYVFLIAIAINARHLFYGIAMVEKLQNVGKVKPYIIFAMCDETFSILVSTEPPPKVDRNAFMFAVAFMHQAYWIIGGIIGGLIGPLLAFNTAGIDFVMTAFFVVVFLNTWMSNKKHTPALIGLTAGVVSLLIFGPGHFIIPAMGLIIIALTVFRKRLEKGGIE